MQTGKRKWVPERDDGKTRMPSPDGWHLSNRSFGLQGRLDLKSPGFRQRFRDVFRVLISARPFPQASGTNVLVRSEFVFLDDLFKRSHCGHDRTDRFGLTPIWIAATFCHRFAIPLPANALCRALL